MSCLVKDYEIVFWDFDGVIKDSAKVKTKAFASMFERYGSTTQDKVVSHHLANCGISRYVKIDLYYRDYIGEPLSSNELEGKCSEFSDIVLKKVIDSAWIEGVEEYIKKNAYGQIFILVTGTPQSEIEYILEKLNLSQCFESVWGAPHEKAKAVNKMMGEYNHLNKAVMIGDSEEDYRAAVENDIPFILRKTDENNELQTIENIICIDNFL